MRRIAIFLLVLLTACSTKLDKQGHTETNVNIKYLAKTEVDRVADTNRAEVLEGLMRIADKLYRRNPKEWKKAGMKSREAALERLRLRNENNWPEMKGLLEGQAAALAFDENYEGDRVAALMYGLLTMTDAAFDHRDEFYIIHALNEIKLFNCARNMEVAIWKLAHDRNAEDELFLLSNELNPVNRNLSFEREFGRLIGLLDFMAKIVADRNGRTLSRLTQTAATMVFLPVGF